MKDEKSHVELEAPNISWYRNGLMFNSQLNFGRQ